jgi:hypothetical protein
MTRALRAVGDIPDHVLARHDPATRLDTLEDVLRWGGHVLEVVVQDEYNHDVVVRGHGDDGFLVFDTT